MTPADLNKVRQLRQKMVDIGIEFDPDVFEVDEVNYTEEDLLNRAEARTSIHRQLEGRGIMSGSADVVVHRLQGDTLKESGWRSCAPVTAAGAWARIESVCKSLGKER